jgi:hypothetical protein
MLDDDGEPHHQPNLIFLRTVELARKTEWQKFKNIGGVRRRSLSVKGATRDFIIIEGCLKLSSTESVEYRYPY